MSPRPPAATPSASRAAVAWLEAHGALERDGDRLVGAHGLTTRVTPHTLTIADRILHTWCALDALAIPVALATTARATSRCPTCGQPLTVEVRDGRLPDDDKRVLWMPTGSCDNVIADFCAHANLFCSTAHLDQWRRTATAPAGRRVTFAEVPAIARFSWADVSTPG